MSERRSLLVLLFHTAHQPPPPPTLLTVAGSGLPGFEVVTPSAATVVGLLRVSPFTRQGPRDEKLSTGLVSGSWDTAHRGRLRQHGVT